MRQHDLSLWTIPSSGKKPTSLQIEEFMIAVIKSRAVKPRECIPSHRTLAAVNKVNRNTALRAYTKLIASGWLIHKHGGKALVASPIPSDIIDFQKSSLPETVPLPLVEQSHLLATSKNISADYLEIGRAIIDNYTLSKAVLKRRRRLIDRKSLEPGEPKLPEVVFRQMQLRGHKISIDNLAIVNGRSEALRSIFDTLYSSDGIVVNTAPSDFMLSHILQKSGMEIINLEAGSVDILSELTKLLEKINLRFLYIRPNGSYPKCSTIDDATCQKLLNLAEKYKFYIVEEDDDHEFWWGRTPPAPLRHYDKNGHVVYCSSLSRSSTYMQNMKVIIGASKLVKNIISMPEAEFGYRDTIEEKQVIELLSNDELITISRSMRLSKLKQLKIISEVLTLQLGKFISYQPPQSGTALWITFPPQIDLLAIFKVLKSEGYRFQLASRNMYQKMLTRNIRLDFSSLDITECQNMAKRIRSLLKNGFV